MAAAMSLSLALYRITLLVFLFHFCLLNGIVIAAGESTTDVFNSQDCKQCPPQDCSSCPKHSPLCQVSARTCHTCPIIKCIRAPGKSKTSAGTIAGAVIGGFAATALLGYVGHRLCAKNRKGRASMAATAAEKENDFGMLRSARASTHTVASIASTVRTRASNIIQIAYIPGVTNRSTPGTPAHLVPPVPPLPFQDSPVGSQFPKTPTGDIQFAASDLLRASVCTTVNEGRSNRSSVATTIYGGSAVVSQPNVIRAGKAAVVQVKGGGSVATSDAGSPSSEQIPQLPALYSTAGKSHQEAVPASPAFSIGTTFFNRMNSVRRTDFNSTPNAPREVVVSERSRVNDEDSQVFYNYDSDDSDPDLVPGHHAKSIIPSQCSSCVTDLDTRSPFSDSNSIIDVLELPAGAGLPHHNGRQSQLTHVVEGNNAGQKISRRTVSPFDDSNFLDTAA